MTRIRTVCILLATLATGGCGGSHPSSQQLTEIARVRSGDIDLVLLSETVAVKQGKDAVTVEFRRSADGTLVDVGTVKGSATMPMAGMPPMFGSVGIMPTDTPGRYLATSALTMAGEWRLALEWNGAAGHGAATLTISAQ